MAGMRGVNDQNLGAAKIVAGHLILTPERPKVRKGFRGWPPITSRSDGGTACT